MNIKVDINDDKYILINAKQYDSNSRHIIITCYENGKLFSLNPDKHSAYIRYRKADGHGVLNSCEEINSKGEVVVKLTEQMLAVEGICYADLIIVEKGNAVVNVYNGELITIDNSPIISTMAFCINVYGATIDNSLIESSDEYNALYDKLQEAEANYEQVIQEARSWATGEGDSKREDKEFDNSKYYSKLSKSYAIGDLDGSTGTKDRDDEGTDNAEYYSRLAKSYAMGDSDGSTKTRDDESSENAKTYMEKAKASEKNAFDYASESKEHSDSSLDSSMMSQSYAMGGTGKRDDEESNNAKYYCEQSGDFADNSKKSADNSQSYAVGGTGTRDGEDTDNAKYYCKEVQSIADNLSTIITDNDGNVISLAELVARFNKLEAEIGNINTILDSINGEVI